MPAELLRPYVVELSSRDNTQRKRVNLTATSRDEAAAICEAREDATVEFQLDDQRLEAAREVALFVPRDTDLNGRFHRAGKVIRLRSEHPDLGTLRGTGTIDGTTVRSAVIGNRETSGLRAEYARHCQERAYRIDRVGDPSLSNVLGTMYGLGWQKQIEGSTGRFVWASDTIKVALATSTYTPNTDTHDFFNDLTNEVSGTGYTSGGATLGSKSSTFDTASDQVRLDAGDVSWTTSTITARYGVVWYDTGGASSTDPLLGLVNFESDVSTTAGTFQITWDSTGLFAFDLT